MIVFELFVVVYGFEVFFYILVIDIGVGISDFCVMNGCYFIEEDQCILIIVGDLVDEYFFMVVKVKYFEVVILMYMICSWKEVYFFVGIVNELIKVEVLVYGCLMMIDIIDEMCMFCEMLLFLIIEMMIDFILCVEFEFQLKVCNNVIFIGGFGLVCGFGEVI